MNRKPIINATAFQVPHAARTSCARFCDPDGIRDEFKVHGCYMNESLFYAAFEVLGLDLPAGSYGSLHFGVGFARLHPG